MVVTLNSDYCLTPFVGIATQVADYVGRYSALSDQPGPYTVTGNQVSRAKPDPHLILCNNVFVPRIVLIYTLSLDERMVL